MMKQFLYRNSYVILLIAISFLLLFAFSKKVQQGQEDTYLMITVENGDSLWNISNKYYDGHRMPFEQFVRWVEKENGIANGVIHAGDSLLIPVKREQVSGTDMQGDLLPGEYRAQAYKYGE